MSRWEYTESELWRFGEGEISIYHVFGSIAVGSTVLVFAEGRHGAGGDASDLHDIYMKKSTDGGKSFGDSICLLACEGIHCFCNPTPLFDAQTGKLFLSFAENFGNARTEVRLMESTDLGESWSTPRDLTPSILEKSDLPFHLPGPGHGIQLQKAPYTGRLLLQIWHRLGSTKLPRVERGYCVSLLYSDDHGAHWSATEPIGHAHCCNESRLCETATGVLFTLRSFDLKHTMARSTDGGVTWGEVEIMPLPPANVCDAGLLALQGRGAYTDTVLLSRISNVEKGERRNMEIRISTDGGCSFPDSFLLPAGDAMPGYSDLCLLREEVEDTVGLLHCRCNHVLFSRISLQALTNGKYDATTRHVWEKL